MHSYATVRGGKQTVVDLRPGSPDASSSQVLYVPTAQRVVDKMLEMAKVTDKDTVFALYSLIATDAERAALAERYPAGGMGYGEAKKMLLAKIDEHFGPFRERRKQLAADPARVEDVLRQGAARARAEAQATMKLVREAAGFGAQPV